MWLNYNHLQESHFPDIYFLKMVSLDYLIMCSERRDLPREMWVLGGGGGCVPPTNPGPEQNLHSSIGTSLRAIALQKETQSILLKGQEAPATLPEICLKPLVK